MRRNPPIGPRPAHRVFTESPAFRAWFDQSVLVREDGDPLVLFATAHGGWFTNDPDAAEAHSDRIMPVYLRVNNPYYADLRRIRGKTREELIAKGYDGIIIARDPMLVCVFDPRQVKSATGNSGAFDILDPDITRNPSGRGRNGRRAALKMRFPRGSASSSLAAPTINPADLKGRSIPDRYLAGLPKAVQKARVRELTRSRDAYKKGDYSELPSDRIARQMGLVKKSAYSEVAERRGIEWRGNTFDMATRVCQYYGVKCNTYHVALGIQQSFNKGLAAWKSGGHRPGATAQNWAVARVASLVVGGKTSLTADRKEFAHFPEPLQKAIAKQRPEVVKELLAQGREDDARVVNQGA